MSFSDMMSSGRGPGVIGMLMGLFVLLGFGLLFMYASSESGPAKQSIESVISQQAKEIDRLKLQIEAGTGQLALAPGRTAVAKELSQLEDEHRATTEAIANLKTTVAEAEAEIASRTQTLAEYKDEYREYVRGNAKGETMEELATVDGTVYKDVSIREVTAIGIQIRHEAGQKRIPFEELSEEMKDRFQFDPAQKEAAAVAEAAVRREHDAAAAVANQMADQQLAANREKEAAADKEKARQNVAALEAQISAMQTDLRRLEQERARATAEADAARRSGKMHINKSGSIGIDIQNRKGRINAMQADLARMKAALN